MTHLRRDVFQAIADPTRRRIIQLLAKDAMNLNAVTDCFTVSRPAISRHMRILTECGLVSVKKQGRERYCHVNLARLKSVNDWTEQYRMFWTGKLNALEDLLEKEKDKKRKKQ